MLYIQNLFRREMLMTRLPTAGPRRGVSCARWALLGGLLGFCLVASGAALRAAPVQVAPPKDEPKKEEPKKADRDDPLLPPLPHLDLPPGLDPAEAQRIQEQLKTVREALRKQLAEMRKISPDDSPPFPPGVPVPPAFAGFEPRPRE